MENKYTDQKLSDLQIDAVEQIHDQVSDCILHPDLYPDGACFDSLCDDLFNSTPYIIGRFDAAQELAKFDKVGYLPGVFGAIDYVSEQYQNEVGASLPADKLVEPEDLLNMVWYFTGSEAFNNILSKLNIDIDKCLNLQDLKKIRMYTARLLDSIAQKEA